MQNDGDFLDVILLYTWTFLEHIMLCSGISAVIKMEKVMIVKLKTASVELSPSLEAGMCSASQEFVGILWNTKVYYAVQYMPPLFSTFR
jgi:hypothetical protein